MERVSVSFIIVNFRTPDLVLRCVQSIQEYTKSLSYEIIIVDNASGDDSAVKLGGLEWITFVPSPRNVGFGGANNVGAKLARGSYLFFLNPDTLLLDDAAGSFFAFMENPVNLGVGCCGGELFDEVMEKQVSYGNFPSLRGVVFELGIHRLFRGDFENRFSIGVKNDGNEVKVVDYVSGADMFVRGELFEKLGGFDTDFFLYFEETEFAYRMKKAGYVSVLIPAVKIVHLEGASHGVREKVNLGKAKYFEASRLQFFKKTQGYATATLVKMLLASQAIVRACLHRDSHYLKLFRIIVRS